MAILKVCQLGNPILRNLSKEVKLSEIKTKEFQKFLDDLVETMRDGMGVGISAPQTHESVRVIAIENVDNKRYPEKQEFPLQIIVNPEIVPVGDDFEEDWEGCLSVDLKGLVPRFKKIKIKYIDRDAEIKSGLVSGFKARVIQHEVDHLDGILFLDRMKNFKTLTKLAEFEKYWNPPSRKRFGRVKKATLLAFKEASDVVK